MNRAEGSGAAALLRDYRNFAGSRLWLALALMLLGAIAEGFGILMLVPLAAIAIGGAGGSGWTARLDGLAAGVPAGERFVIALGLFVGAMAVRSILLFARDIQLARLGAGYEASLRLRAAATLAKRGWSFATRIGHAGMQSLLLTDVPRAGLAISQAQQFAIAAVMVIVQLLIAAMLSPALTGVALVILLIASLASVRWMRRGVASGQALVESSEDSTGSGFRLHSGLKAALAQGTVGQFLNEYRSSLDRLKREVARFARDLSAARTLSFLASAVAAAVLLFVGHEVLKLALPVLIASLVLFARMAAPSSQLQNAAQNVAANAPSFEAIERRLGTLDRPAATQPSSPPLEWKQLRAQAISYEHAPGLGIRGVSLTLERGEWVGIAGPSGAGKSTLIDLLAGLLVPQSGILEIDGRALGGATLDGWRTALAYVGQDGSVFDDSIRGNLLADGATADDDALWQALDAVGLAVRVRAFPAGLDQRVGNRGSELSGGERQRLAIARALLRKASLLILDEATAALDPEAEAGILGCLRASEPRPAALLVAHRASTLAHCDSVVSIQHGLLEKGGSPSVLAG